jgi:hypothetical protein
VPTTELLSAPRLESGYPFDHACPCHRCGSHRGLLRRSASVGGCGAGQITQTDSQVAAVDGTYGNVGNSIALRNVLIPYPPNQTGTYPIGAAVPVLFTIINQGDSADELVGVDSPAANQVVVEGTTQVPPVRPSPALPVPPQSVLSPPARWLSGNCASCLPPTRCWPLGWTSR